MVKLPATGGTCRGRTGAPVVHSPSMQDPIASELETLSRDGFATATPMIDNSRLRRVECPKPCALPDDRWG
jgi:hypothetical protein